MSASAPLAAPNLSRWLLGLIGSLVAGLLLAAILGGVSWLTSLYTLTHFHGEKIAVLESQIADQRRQLDRIDQKLDQLLRMGDRPTVSH